VLTEKNKQTNELNDNAENNTTGSIKHQGRINAVAKSANSMALRV